jgi:23S rRNA pseudouridine1911/1915/1917 synthase
MNIQVIFEDQDLLVINKPAGVVVNEAESVVGETIQGWLVPQLQPQSLEMWQDLVPVDFDDSFGTSQEIFTQRQGIVHRLDKDTSGVMVMAKNPGALVNLLAQFKKRQTQKKYLCLAHGKFRIPVGNISAPLGRMSADRQKFAVVADGRAAETKYEVKEFYVGLNDEGMKKLSQFKKKIGVYQGFSLVECWPKTGRTHQIRVHMKHWKHPLVGDDKYVGKKRAKLDKLWCVRQFLHAAELELAHPRSGEVMKFKAELSDDLQAALALLERSI